MPCNMVVTNAVDLGTCDRATLIEALTDLGFKPVVSEDIIGITTPLGRAVITAGGELIMSGSTAYNAAAVKDQVKQGVMKKAIEKAAKKFGWKVEPVKGAKNRIKIKHG